jgi:sugar lactone lactonase YvrE
MKVDRDGNFHCCGPGGLHVSSPDARSLGVIGTPEVVANFTWSDDDLRRSILLTASTSLYRVRTKTSGVALSRVPSGSQRQRCSFGLPPGGYAETTD